MNNTRKSRFLLTTAVLLAGVSVASAQGMREGGGGGTGASGGAGGGGGVSAGGGAGGCTRSASPWRERGGR